MNSGRTKVLNLNLKWFIKFPRFQLGKQKLNTYNHNQIK